MQDVEKSSPALKQATWAASPEKGSKLWLLYLLATTILLWIPAHLLTAIPMLLVARVVRPFRLAAETYFSRSVAFLMRLQPWYLASNSIEVQRPSHRGLLIVSNHRSNLDVFMLLSRVPGVRILAKSQLFFIPGLGLMMWLTGQIPIARRRAGSFWKALERAASVLREGGVVHIFPELTRCDEGMAGTLNFSSAPFRLAKNTGALVLPVVFKNTDVAWPKGHALLRPHIEVSARSLPALDPRDFETAEALGREARRLITEALTC